MHDTTTRLRSEALDVLKMLDLSGPIRAGAQGLALLFLEPDVEPQTRTCYDDVCLDREQFDRLNAVGKAVVVFSPAPFALFLTWILADGILAFVGPPYGLGMNIAVAYATVQLSFVLSWDPAVWLGRAVLEVGR